MAGFVRTRRRGLLGQAAALAALAGSCSLLAPDEGDLLGDADGETRGGVEGRGGSEPAGGNGNPGGSSALGGRFAEGGAAPGLEAGAAGGEPVDNAGGVGGGVGIAGDGNAGSALGGGPSGGEAGTTSDGGAGRGAGGRAGGGAGGQGGNGGALGGGGGAGGRCAVTTCNANATCMESAAGPVCRCVPGFVGSGQSCRRPVSCDELHVFAPSLATGTYPIRPALATSEFPVHCEMSADLGGWTLVLNHGLAFSATAAGVGTSTCYSENCTSLAYSTVPVGADLRLDMNHGDIVDEVFLGRAVITGIHLASRNKTLRELFTTGPHYVEQEDNANVRVIMGPGLTCDDLPADINRVLCDPCLSPLTCGSPVMVFGDHDRDPGCGGPLAEPFAIGAALSYTSPWTNCGGWPQLPSQFYPDNFRVWVR